MKFELKPYNRNVSDKDFLNDLRRVASELKLDSLSVEEYDKNGKYHPSTIQRRFGSWTKALKSAGLQLRKNPKIEADELIDDLKRVAGILNKKSVTQNEYKSLGKYDSAPLVRTFGSWFKALEKAGLEKTRTLGVTNEEYFENLEEIWTKLGRQPNYIEIEKPFSKYSAGAYEQRFGSWRKALEAFIEYVNHGKNEPREEQKSLPIERLDVEAQATKHKTNRTINWRLRFIIMKRDNFKCKKCGRSPATDPTIILHVDHKTAWANGGETVLENLETLCSKCNIGKSDL
ncbi:MAG TPA: HNH endonuclease [Candidatus Paceibacterota bacterium]|nr:HNH endonuclease [Candidatus Paceibacterota bacterium]